MSWLRNCALLLCIGLLPQPANADVLTQTDYIQFATAVTDQVVIPAYERLAIETALLRDTVAATCSDPTPAALQATYDRFHDTMDAWARAQPILLGPVMDAPGPARFQFWPDKRGTGQRQLRRVLTASEQSVLDAKTLNDKSIALNDLQALEYVLYDDTNAFETPGSFLCAYAAAIADVQKTRAAVLLRQWTQDGGFRSQVTDASAGTDAFFDEREAASAYLNSIIGALEVIRLQKLDRPLGLTLEGARGKRAESWRSARSLRNIQLNFETIHRLLTTENGLIDLTIKAQSKEDATTATRLAEETRAEILKFEQPLSQLVSDATARPGLEALLTKLRNLQLLIQDGIARDVELVRGFNATDGD
jgi:uncharacterized protein